MLTPAEAQKAVYEFATSTTSWTWPNRDRLLDLLAVLTDVSEKKARNELRADFRRLMEEEGV